MFNILGKVGFLNENRFHFLTNKRKRSIVKKVCKTVLNLL